MHKIFIGYDERQPLSFTVLAQSIIAQASEPVAIIPLKLSTLPIKRAGLTPFTWSRFLVPHLCRMVEPDEMGSLALFLDVDIVLNGDICQLFELVEEKRWKNKVERKDLPGFYNPSSAVYVSKNEHRFEWASVMMFDCKHSANDILTPEYIETADRLHSIEWCKPEEIGDLPREWNQLVGYDKPNEEAKLVHYTQGIPAYPETIECEHSELWHQWHQYANYTQPWEKLMGASIHAVQVNNKKLPKFLFDLEKQVPKPEHEEIVKKILTAA